jgi:hypothetical protein
LEGIEKALKWNPTPGSNADYIASLRARLDEFERRHEMRTKTMLEELRSGRLKETLGVTKWALLAEHLAAIEQRSPDASS